jgi:hypothetical protein
MDSFGQTAPVMDLFFDKTPSVAPYWLSNPVKIQQVTSVEILFAEKLFGLI